MLKRGKGAFARAIFGIAIFTSAFLLFQVTPDRECISPFAPGQSTPRISSDDFALARRRLAFLELASLPRPFLETGSRRGSDPGNRGIIIYQCGPAVSSSFQHGAVVAKLVCPS